MCETVESTFIVITLVEGLNDSDVAAYLLLVTPPTTADGITAKLKFPICSKSSCKINSKGVLSAYRRARQYGYDNVAKKALKIAKKEKFLI